MFFIESLLHERYAYTATVFGLHNAKLFGNVDTRCTTKWTWVQSRHQYIVLVVWSRQSTQTGIENEHTTFRDILNSVEIRNFPRKLTGYQLNFDRSVTKRLIQQPNLIFIASVISRP
jgi:hypothetical protein